jgi:glyoxylase-like metal-dependent hydrolase (beta-lactamase superfamily II)
MKVHHINAATLCPMLSKLVTGTGALMGRGHMVCHCLLIETPSSGLVLVDTGFGTEDLRSPETRLGKAMLKAAAPKLDPEECAIAHVRRLGFDTSDVTHIVLTHMDLDHAGGISDFPKARVHVLADEHAAARALATTKEQARYRPQQWAHNPLFELARPAGQRWKGFEAVRELPGLPPEILMLPLSGHTRGHACVAVETSAGALVHAGDAYFHRGAIAPEGNIAPAGAQWYEAMMAFDRKKLEANHARLRELAQDSDVKVFCAHDVPEFEALTSATVS